MKLEITKERVLEAASKCSTAKETLKILFPGVFETDENRIVAERGDKFIINNNIYMLCCVDCSKYALICLDDANRWSDPINVNLQKEINYIEFRNLISDVSLDVEQILKTKHR